MKKAKILLWLIILGFIALVIYQNKEFFFTEHSFGINLLVFDYRSPEIYSAVLFVIFFLLGLLIAYLFGLFERYKTNKTVKEMKAANNSLEEMIRTLKNDLESFKADQPQATVVDASIPETNADEPSSSS